MRPSAVVVETARGWPMLAVAALALFVVTAEPAPPATPGQAIAVLPLQARQGVSADGADLLTSNLVAHVRAHGRFTKVVSKGEMEALMGFEQQKQLLACDSGSCMAELAGALGVDYVLTGSVGRLGDQFILNLSLLNTKTAQSEGTVSIPVAGKDEGALLSVMRDVPRQLFGAADGTGPAPQPVVASAPAREPPATKGSEGAVEKKGGMAGTALKGIGGAGLGVGALALLPAVAGALVAGGTWGVLYALPGLTRGLGAGLLISAAYGGGILLVVVGVLVSILSVVLGGSMLAAGFFVG